MREAELRQTRQLIFEMLPPTHVGMSGVPCEELDLDTYYALNRMTLRRAILTMTGFWESSGPSRI